MDIASSLEAFAENRSSEALIHALCLFARRCMQMFQGNARQPLELESPVLARVSLDYQSWLPDDIDGP